MSENGVKTNFLSRSEILDEVLGNRDGTTVAATISTLSKQLLGSGPLAETIASIIEQTAEDLAATGADVVAAEAARDAAISAGAWGYTPADGTDNTGALGAITGMVEGETALVLDTMHVWEYDGADWIDTGLSPISYKLDRSEFERVFGSQGFKGTLSAGSAAISGGTYTLGGGPIGFAGKGVIFSYYARTAGSYSVLVFSLNSSTGEKTVLSKFPITLVIGENTLFLPDITFSATDHIGFTTGSGQIGAIAGSGVSYYSASGQVLDVGESYTDTTASKANLMLRFDFIKLLDGEVVLEHENRLNVVETTIGDSSPVETIGRPIGFDPVSSASGIGTSTYIFDETFEDDKFLDEFEIYVKTAGTFYLSAYDKSGLSFSKDGGDYLLTATATGLQSLSGLPEMILKAGQNLGLRKGTGDIALTTATGDSGGYYSGTDADEFTVASGPQTNLRFEFRASFKSNGLAARVARLEDATGAGGAKPDSFHLHWMLTESHGPGRSPIRSSIEVPVGSGYNYRRANEAFSQLIDPTGNDSTSLLSGGKGSWGPAMGDALLRATGNTIGLALVNSGVGSTYISSWEAGDPAWLQAVEDWGFAVADLKAKNVDISGVSVGLAIGSNDASVGTSKAAFKAGVLDLYARAKSLVGAGDQLPLILMQTGPFADGSYAAEVAVIQEAQIELVNENEYIFMGYTGMKYGVERSWFIDSVHFSQAFNDAAGRALPSVMLAHGSGLYPAGLLG